MARLPHAAKQLIAQATEHHSRTKASGFGDPDGLGVMRSINFNKATGKWLEPLLDVMDDPRVTGHETAKDGTLVVHFSTGINADDAAPFPLDDAAEVAGARSTGK